MKIFVFAVQCGGKTTLAQYLRNATDHEVVEMDDEIMRLNGGSWPANMQYKTTRLEPIIYESVSAKQDVIFMDNHLAAAQGRKLKQSGFTMTYMELSLEELMRRNKQRFESGAQDDASQWIDTELHNAEEIRNEKLFDYIISGEQPTDKIAKELLRYTSKPLK